MTFEKIHLIHPVSSAAEEEYTKKFLRFIGCQVYGRPVNESNPLEWNSSLFSVNEDAGSDIVMNYYGDDPYLADSLRRGLRRIYFYFDLDQGLCDARERAVSDPSQLIALQGKANIRQNALRRLIQTIWKEEPDAQRSILKIHELYFGLEVANDPATKNDDLFFLLQTKRCMRVMTMGEILSDPDAYIRHIPPYSYVCHILERLSNICFTLDTDDTIYGLYTRVNAAMAIFGILEKLYPNDREKVKAFAQIRVMSKSDVFALLEELLARLPDSIPVVLLYARFCKYSQDLYQMEESIYRYLQQLIPTNQRGYAYIWYRIGRYYEKIKQRKEQAVQYYEKAVHTDPDCYQAVFKLGYFAALDNRFKEAELRLNEVVEIMFHGNDMGPDAGYVYPNWDYLSLKDCQYAYKAYILLAKIAINSDREYSTRAFIGSACLAATKFEASTLESTLSGGDEPAGIAFFEYHRYSTPVWSMWKVLSTWSEHIIQDDFVKRIVRGHLASWN